MTGFIDSSGSLTNAGVDALVNTVNTVGIMGKGIALEFKQSSPENFKAYEQACEHGEVTLGSMFVHNTGRIQPRWIINFPTKKHWRSRSRIIHIKAGLMDLRRVIIESEIKSIAIPRLGCGNGGLGWAEVRPLITAALDDLDLTVHLYEPVVVPALPICP